MEGFLKSRGFLEGFCIYKRVSGGVQGLGFLDKRVVVFKIKRVFAGFRDEF